MNETAEMIREQMNDTRANLSGKLDSLERQVSRTVRSTSTAVNATVGAVQETVQSVTGAVHDAARSVGNALDVPRQVGRHPWLALGGSVALGYFAAKVLACSKQPQTKQENSLPHCLATENGGNENTEPAVQTAALAAAYESGQKSSTWRELRSMAIGALMGIAQEVVSHAIPQVIHYLTSKSAAPGERPKTSASDATNNQ